MRRLISIALAWATFMLLAPVALADTSDSTNWAGYAVHRAGESFDFITGSWKQPGVACRRGRQTYSAYWVGLGGYSLTSNALEQIGTEADCAPGGQPVLSAWYELIPAPSVAVRMTVAVGDEMNAQVSVTGHQVVLTMSDLTRHETFSKPVRARQLDLTSAEWIVEAPSECMGNACQTLPLANFGSAVFTAATIRTGSGDQGAIADHAWTDTKIVLKPAGRAFVRLGSGSNAGAASPSGLQQDGSSFKVDYRRVSLLGRPVSAVSDAVTNLATHVGPLEPALVHPLAGGTA